MGEKQGKIPGPKLPQPLALADKVENFVKWMEDETDFCMWDLKIKREVQIKLIECMTEVSR